MHMQARLDGALQHVQLHMRHHTMLARYLPGQERLPLMRMSTKSQFKVILLIK